METRKFVIRAPTKLGPSQLVAWVLFDGSLLYHIGSIMTSRTACDLAFDRSKDVEPAVAGESTIPNEHMCPACFEWILQDQAAQRQEPEEDGEPSPF